MMDYRRLGRTGLHVSTVGMGTWKSFDVRGTQEIDHVHALVTEALRCGVNLFDTAPRIERVKENTNSAEGPALPQDVLQRLEGMIP
jgi:predicted aldo/keto reductase-like oxidoreductase